VEKSFIIKIPEFKDLWHEKLFSYKKYHTSNPNSKPITRSSS